MILFFILFSFKLAMAQELELTTNNVQVYARVKNCIDFYLCSPYEETLKIDHGYYRWKVQFKEPLSKIQTAFNECSVGNLDFDITLRDEFGVARTDFSIPRNALSSPVEINLLPMELYARTYEGLKSKEKLIQTFLQSKEPLPAMKSTTFEMEYPLEEYQLNAHPLNPNVLAITHHLKKIIVYDLDKWDGSVCRFYEVMRHETQHVRNRRKQLACNGNHHFRAGNNDERSTYLNDLVFLKRYCPGEKALYLNVESILLKMYLDKQFQTCGVAPGNSTYSGEGAKPSNPSGHTHKTPHRVKFMRRLFKSKPAQTNPNGLN